MDVLSFQRTSVLSSNQLIHSGKRRIEFSRLVVVALQALSTVAQPVTECASWVAGRDATLSKGATCRKESRGCNKRSARTRGEILKYSETGTTLNSPIPSGVKGASALRLSLRDPRRAEIGLTRETILHVQQPRFHWSTTSQRPGQPARRG